MPEMERKRMHEMQVGEAGVIRVVNGTPVLRRRFLELGITPGTPVICVGRAPFGDPVSYRIRGNVFALRCADTERIEVEIHGKKGFANRK